MTTPRERDTPQGGTAGGGGGLAPDDAFSPQPQTGAVVASGAGYGNLTFLRTGYYHDLNSDGQGFSSTTDTFDFARVPPGNSYNEDHYASEYGPGEARGNSTSELIAAVIRLDGEMRSAVTAEFTWTRPDGGTAFSGSATLEDPEQRFGNDYHWEYVYFYSFIGRDFGQGGTAEVTEPGEYEIEFDTNYGTYSKTVDVVGPYVTDCSLPNTVPAGTTAEATITCTKANTEPYSFDVRLAECMTANRTNREGLVIAEQPVGMAPTELTKEVDIPFQATRDIEGRQLCVYATDAY